MVSLCVDDSFRLESGCMGYGGLIRDNQGLWMAGFHGFMLGGNVLMAEAYDLKHGLQLAWERGLIKSR